ncbi:hypothetical protein MLD52_03400 [Puniceicoccaceae bacterium K14]|nr:hypothetical protein [Puniceicoccaceae bacterium K14]
MSVTRILVLTSSTGGGHDARASAFREWAKELYGWKVEVRVEKMLEDSSRLAAFGVWFYNFIQKHAPWFHHPYYCAIEGLSYLNSSRVSFGRKYFERVVESYRPHLIFSVHDCLNRGYFQTARRIMGEDNVRCATYCSEFSGGYGYSRNWVEPTVDLYFSRTDTSQDYAVGKLGLPAEKGRVRGHFLEPRLYSEVLNPEERHRFITERLGLRGDRKTVFLTAGGAGANNHLALLPILKRFSDKYQALVVCGRNHDTYSRALKWQKDNPELSCHIEGYCSDMHLFLQVSDFVVTRGGTTTCSEALQLNCPIVFNGIGGVMPQEKLTVKYFMKPQAGALISSPEDFEKLLVSWYRSPERFDEIRERFKQRGFNEDPSLAIRELVELAGSVAEKEGEGE